MKKIKSIILPVILIILIIAVTCRRFYFSGADDIFPKLFLIVIYIIWMIFEAGVPSSDCGQKKTISDSGTREIYAIGQAITILSAIWFSPPSIRINIIHITGSFLFILGISIRVWAINTLGIYYSHVVMTTENHKIIDEGPYRFIRHPAYAGMILAHFGVLLSFFNNITLLVIITVFIPSIIIRIIIEEKTLSTIAGYSEFAIKRKRLIPGIW